MLTRGLVVIVRIVGAIFFGFLGLRAGQALAEGDTGLVKLLFWTVTPVGFTLFGALATPIILIPLLQRFQDWAKAIKPIQLVLGTAGLLAGLLVGALLSPALFTLPGIGGLIAPFIVSFVLGILGVAVMVGREEEFAGFLDRYAPGAAKTAAARDIVVDTSVIIDGRIADVAATGFLQGRLVIPRFVLDELRHIADSPDALRRNRGRRGLEVLSRLQKEAPIPIRIADEDFPDARDVDGKLIRLCQQLKAPILTNDFNLNRIAELEGIQVLNINSLANTVRVVILPGEEMAVRIIQEGKEVGQGVGFLDDGTMVVVEGGRRYLNEQLDVTVTRVLQTVAGRMIFAQPKGA
ncbi:MAG TPA: PIN domain-containing protein [Dehalococcoidia bacterium]|nr:PIN domain-containing protein [Dehalococcoidia bacterium]